MANAKRASMREGPLAALFRKTEEDEAAGQDGAPRASAAQAATAAAAEREADGAGAAPPAPAHPRGSDSRPALPHPALSGSGEPEVDEPAVPSPRERLRHAFSSEIPDNVMEPPRVERFERGHSLHYEPEVQRPAAQLGQPVIRVVGVGGGGVNAVNRMVEAEVEGIEFLAVNTDVQSLQQSTADITLHIGAELTRGLGAGSDANVGRGAAMEDYDRMKALLKGSDMIFITAGAGGGTGTGAAPVVARIARELGALTVAIVTKPFGFEGSRRSAQGEQGVAALAEEVDTLIVVPNNRLLDVLEKGTSMMDAFRVADDVRTIMSEAGSALLGIGMGVGENRAVEAAMQAVSSPLLETSMDGARSILLSITGGANLSLWEVNEAAKSVSEAAHPDANIIFGAMIDEKLDDQVWVTVVATGYGDQGRRRSVEHYRSRSAGGSEPHDPEAGEVRVHRAGSSRTVRSGYSGSGEQPTRRRVLDDLEIPEFIPNP